MTATAAILNILLFFIGQYLITRKDRKGFMIWGFSNLLIVRVSIANDHLYTACMFIIYFLANAYSLILWARQATRNQPSLMLKYES